MHTDMEVPRGQRFIIMLPDGTPAEVDPNNPFVLQESEDLVEMGVDPVFKRFFEPIEVTFNTRPEGLMPGDFMFCVLFDINPEKMKCNNWRKMHGLRMIRRNGERKPCIFSGV